MDIKTLREQFGISSTILANILGVTGATICGWEKGRSPIPSIYKVIFMQLEEKTKIEPAEHVGKAIKNFLLSGGIMAFLHWLFNTK